MKKRAPPGDIERVRRNAAASERKKKKLRRMAAETPLIYAYRPQQSAAKHNRKVRTTSIKMGAFDCLSPAASGGSYLGKRIEGGRTTLWTVGELKKRQVRILPWDGA